MTATVPPNSGQIKRKRKTRRLLVSMAGVFVAAAIGAAAYAYYEFNRENEDLKNVRPDITITSAALMKEFTENFKTADSLYKNKVVELTGVITKIDSTDMPVIVFFGEKNSMSSIQCSMDPEHHAAYRSITTGTNSRLKGIYIGAISQEIFGIDIKLNRCVIIK